MSVTIIDQPSYDVVLAIMENLRSLDRLEVSATSFSDDPEDWAEVVHRAGAFQWAMAHDGEPVALVGAANRWGNVWSGWCLGTKDFPKVALTVTKHIKRVMLPVLFEGGMLRIDAFVLDNYDNARKWVRLLGAREEATLECWGKNGETFVSYVWLREVRQAAGAHHQR